MPLSVGEKLGPYEILTLVGAGGMGEVWKARDTRLDRIVAIKFSQAQFSERFEREARAIAALNHPNIAQIYDVGENYIVMEYVDGEPVRSVDNTRKLLDISVQIADGLAAAHAAGFIHRDLKPDNILVTKDGRVKILDFGIARRTTSQPVAGGQTQTLSSTEPGIVIGTVGYMSPEQVRGDDIDYRSDIFSFGVILHELLSGAQPFQRATAVETMHAILKEDAPELPTPVAPGLRRVVTHALEKAPERRFQSARDLAFALEMSATATAPTPAAVPATTFAWKRVLLWTPAVLACVAALAWYIRPRRGPSPEVRYTPFATDRCNERQPAWSPDGRSIAYVCDVDGVGQVFTRALDAPLAAQITHGNVEAARPFWSNDAARIYFQQGRERYVVSATGSAPQLLLSDAAAAALSPDGRELAFFRRSQGSLWLARADGSSARRLEGKGLPETFRVAVPRFSPDGTKLAVLILTAVEGDVSRQLWIMPLKGGRPVRTNIDWIGYAASLGSPLWAPDARHIIVSMTSGSSSPSAGLPANDVAGQAHLYEVDTATGQKRALTSGPLSEIEPEISPDGKRLAATIQSHNSEIYEYSTENGKGRPLIAGSREDFGARWAPSGREFAYIGELDGNLRVWFRGENGPSRALTLSGPPLENIRALEFSPDGSRLALDSYGRPHRALLVPASGGVPIPVDTTGNKDTHGAAFSPDGSWIAYTRYLHKHGHPADTGWISKLQASGAGQPVDLAGFPTSPGFPVQWSPAGDWIAFSINQPGLRLISPDGQSQRVLSNVLYATWTFDTSGAHIYGLRRGDARRWELWVVDVATCRERKLAVLDTPVEAELSRLSMHPDGKRFLVTYGTSSSDIWLIDGVTN